MAGRKKKTKKNNNDNYQANCIPKNDAEREAMLKEFMSKNSSNPELVQHGPKVDKNNDPLVVYLHDAEVEA